MRQILIDRSCPVKRPALVIGPNELSIDGLLSVERSRVCGAVQYVFVSAIGAESDLPGIVRISLPTLTSQCLSFNAGKLLFVQELNVALECKRAHFAQGTRVWTWVQALKASNIWTCSRLQISLIPQQTPQRNGHSYRVLHCAWRHPRPRLLTHPFASRLVKRPLGDQLPCLHARTCQVENVRDLAMRMLALRNFDEGKGLRIQTKFSLNWKWTQ